MLKTDLKRTLLITARFLGQFEIPALFYNLFLQRKARKFRNALYMESWTVQIKVFLIRSIQNSPEQPVYNLHQIPQIIVSDTSDTTKNQSSIDTDMT